MTMTMNKDCLFNLPEVVNFEKIEKKYIDSAPDLTMFNYGQKAAFDRLWWFVTETNGGMILLQGYAGTGKSFVINKLVHNFLFVQKTKNIAVTAPTNKAVKVLRNFSSYTHTNLSYSTIHSLLGLKEKIDAYGNQSFVRDPKEPCSLDSYEVLILDECSMLSDEIFEMLQPFVHKGLKLIFMGDPCQINPIGKEEAIPLNPAKQMEYGITVCELKEIVRQKEGNPIIETTMTVRNGLYRDNCLIIRDSQITENSGVLYVKQADGNFLDELIKIYFNSENFKNSSDFVKIIAWRNKTVDFMNNRVRTHLFGPTAGKLEIGERLLANRPICDEEKILFTTNDEMTVKGFEVKTEMINDSIPLNYYETIVMDDNGKDKQINIIHENSEERYKTICQQLAQLATNKPKGSFLAKRAWEDYFEFLDYFSDVKYCYAITSHKSQGSTYDTAIVMEGDINNNRKVVERNRLKYTAMSRPSRLLLIVE